MDTSGTGRSHRRARLQALRDAALHRKDRMGRFAADWIGNRGFQGRWTRRDWAQASLAASVIVLLGAIVPGFSESTAPRDRFAGPQVTHALALPELPVRERKSVAGDSWRIVTIEPGQTLGAIFEDMGVPATTMYRILEQPGAREALTRLRPGAQLAFDMPEGGGLRMFRYDRNDTQRVELAFDGDTIRELVIERPTETRVVTASGRIDSSLYAAARATGMSPAAVVAMTDNIFQYDIDFDRDTKRGDSFSVVYEETWREGERIGTGDVLAASFTTGGKTYTGLRHERDGKVEYFDLDGRPLKKSFIRMPIPYARLTSRFGARRHPVLGRTRMHKGVDYGAGAGTPIMAAGDARVAFAGWRGGYGRAVILDHGRGYTTLYAHMSRFGKYKAGQRVPQGAVIGYVGSSGMSTGPHLHYEFRVNGVHRDPLSITMPPPEPLKGAALAAFREKTGRVLAQLRKLEDREQRIQVAAADAAGGKTRG
jgi:murein DD-endopeptidase MepM/ murein hydrolase activator NlpD